MKINIDEFIKSVDNNIKNYAIDYEKIGVDFKIATQNQINILYERTLSSITNYFIYSEFQNLKADVGLGVNEIKIFFENGINAFDFSTLKKEVGLKPKSKSDREMWENYCVPDGFFVVNNVLNEPLYLFVEYKLNQDLVYIDLALDYLKYKAYTYKSHLKSVFAFVIFDKKEKYPTIINSGPSYFQILDKAILPTMDMEKRVYIYKNLEIKDKDDDSDFSFNELSDSIQQFVELSNLSSDILCHEDKIGLIEDNNIFINSMEKFNKRVINAQIIRDNYNYIVDIWNACKKKNIFDGIYEDFNLHSKEELTNEIIIDEGSHYSACFDESINLKARLRAMEDGIRGSSYASLNVIVLIDYFNDYFGIDKTIMPMYGKTKIGKNIKEKEEVDFNKTAIRQKRKIDEHYGSDSQKSKKIKKLTYALMYYIKNLYEAIYDIGEDNTIGEYNEAYETYILTNQFNERVEKISRRFKYTKPIRLNIDLKNTRAKLLNLVEHIITQI
ncbi:MAG: hypothetical protein MJ208_00175 [Bacilli bacterium]|nr:hypothetical protein [Bacilli bacterium]